MPLSPVKHSFLDQHLKEKLTNHDAWLESALTQKLKSLGRENFPYELYQSAKCEGQISERVTVNSAHNGFPKPQTTPKPCYVAMIPHLSTGSPRPVTKLLKLIQREAFGQSPCDSAKLVRIRFAIVVGINQMHSLDHSKNRAFRRQISAIPTVEGVSSRIIGTLWNPSWMARDGSSDTTYPIKKAYRVLKALRPKAAKLILHSLETSRKARQQVPFQRLREWLKNCEQSQELVTYFHQKSPEAPIYASTMDDDAVSLNGLFTIYDHLIADFAQSKGHLPQLLSTGYTVPQTETDMLQLGVKIDMAVRGAMARVLPVSPYFPEPNLIFLLRNPETSLKSWKFIGPGRTLSSLRLIQNGVASKVLKRGRAVFAPRPVLVTTPPSRMKRTIHQRLGKIDGHSVGRIGVLRALWGIPQSHAIPREWASRIYAALPIKCKPVTKATLPLQTLFRTFCPKDFAIAVIKGHYGCYKSKAFSEAMELHASYLATMSKALLGKSPFEESRLAFLQSDRVKKGPFNGQMGDYLKEKVKKGRTALRQLKDLGLSNKWQRRCVRAAANSGLAIAKELKVFLD